MTETIKKDLDLEFAEYSLTEPDGTVFWYRNDELHRTDGPAIQYQSGENHYYQHGRLHRPDGPAIEFVNGDCFWFQNDKLHRLDGPAIDYVDGVKLWYYEDQEMDCGTQEEFKRLINLKAFW